METKTLRVVLVIWTVVWAVFWVRPFVLNKSLGKEYLRLARSDFEGRRQMTYGRDFYEFLKFCEAKLPAGSRFRLVGLEYASIERARAFYYLYPCLLSQDRPEFLLVYKSPQFRAGNTTLYASLNEESFILQIHPH